MEETKTTVEFSEDEEKVLSDGKALALKIAEILDDRKAQDIKIINVNKKTIIADYFVKRRKNPDYKGSREAIKHIDEFFKLMKVLTKDKNLENVYNNTEDSNGGDENMDK